ncbi:hypothetical protein BH11VER1_BH11VER1_23380 [soil metagenome]
MKVTKFTRDQIIGDTLLSLPDGRKVCGTNIHAKHSRAFLPRRFKKTAEQRSAPRPEPVSKHTSCFVLVDIEHLPAPSASNTERIIKTQIQSSHLTLTGTVLTLLNKGDVLVLDDTQARLENDEMTLFKTAKVAYAEAFQAGPIFFTNFTAYSSSRSTSGGGAPHE